MTYSNFFFLQRLRTYTHTHINTHICIYIYIRVFIPAPRRGRQPFFPRARRPRGGGDPRARASKTHKKKRLNINFQKIAKKPARPRIKGEGTPLARAYE